MNPQTQSQIQQVGYPDFWPISLEKNRRFFLVTQNVGTTINEVFGVGMTEPLHKVARHLSKMVANSMSAVMVLGLNGFGIDGLKVARSMFEMSVTVAYLRKHPEELDDFLDFHFIVGMKRHEYIEKYAPHLLNRITPEAVASIRNGYARVSPRYMNKNGKVRGRWSKKSFGAICFDVDPKLGELYLTLYDLTSRVIHGDISGVAAQSDPEPGVLDVDIAPSEKFVALALMTAHGAFVRATSEYITIARPELQPIADSLEEDFVTAWK
jgi:hypothetical protein